MSFEPNKKLTARVERAALTLLARDGRITYPVLLREMEILSAQDFDAWRAGRVACLEKVIRTNLTKLARIQTAIRRFAAVPAGKSDRPPINHSDLRSERRARRQFVL